MSLWRAPSLDGKVVTVVGLGAIGKRIILSWIQGGFNVHGYDSSPYQRNATAALVLHATSIKQPQKKEVGQLQVFENLADAVADAWLIIESVPDEIKLKVDLFESLDNLADRSTILATSSSINLARDLFVRVSEPTREQMLNMHYSLPLDNRLVELMGTSLTSPSLLLFLSEQLEKCGMASLIAKKESYGLVVDRIWAAIKRETLMLLAEGITTPNELDESWAVYFENPAKGPCHRMDEAGLDKVATIEQHYANRGHSSAQEAVAFLTDNFIAAGATGTNSRNGGLYSQTSRTRTDMLSPLIYVLDLGTAVAHPSKHTGKMCLGSLAGGPLQTLLEDQPRPDGIDVSLTTGRVYWTNMGVPGHYDGLIRSCNLQGGDVKNLLPPGIINTPKQIALDHKSSMLYFCDREGMKVWRCDLNGNGLEILIQAGNTEDDSHKHDSTRFCVGVCISPETGKFYWTQKGPSKGAQGRIFRANTDMPKGMTAADRDDIECFLERLPEPIDLEIDDETQTLWWTDRGDYPNGNTLNKLDLNRWSDDQPEKTIVARHFHEAIGLKIDWIHNQVYLTDIGGTVYVCDVDGNNKRRLYDVEDSAFSGICLVHI